MINIRGVGGYGHLRVVRHVRPRISGNLVGDEVTGYAPNFLTSRPIFAVKDDIPIVVLTVGTVEKV